MRIKQVNDYVDYEVISRVIKDAFRVPPWNIPDMPDIEIIKRLHMYEPGTCNVYAALTDPSAGAWTPPNETEVVGISWFGIPRREAIPDMVLEHVARFWPNRCAVYYGATAVCREWQRKGIATKLKEGILNLIDVTHPGCVIYTRIRSDNTHMIDVNESKGFVRSGLVSEINENGSKEEWWFRAHS